MGVTRALPVVGAADAASESVSWKWQLRHQLRTLEDFIAGGLRLDEDEIAGIQARSSSSFPIGVTPYYFSLIDKADSSCPIRRQVVPRYREMHDAPAELRDPLGEARYEVAPNLVRRYPDRALLFATEQCPIYCRFCTRSRLVGAGGGARGMAALESAFAYIEANDRIREVILSGGDPLTMSTHKIGQILRRLRLIPHIEIIRLGTRAVAALPQRIDGELVRLLAACQPLWVMTHFNHPKELTPRASAAANALAAAGVPLLNHTVLLRGINDDAGVLERLFRGLLRLRVKPYYLLQADLVRGTSHLRTPLATGLALMQQLQGRVSGLALPRFIVDTPGGFGKAPAEAGRAVSPHSDGEEARTRFRTWGGVEVDYVDTAQRTDQRALGAAGQEGTKT